MDLNVGDVLDRAAAVGRDVALADGHTIFGTAVPDRVQTLPS
ncbi:hypothetical protein [Actinoplanes cyaneus]|nr:hypothetical protein [Actinoplanes cyaneus]